MINACVACSAKPQLIAGKHFVFQSELSHSQKLAWSVGFAEPGNRAVCCACAALEAEHYAFSTRDFLHFILELQVYV
jgi:hypothetical protein